MQQKLELESSRILLASVWMDDEHGRNRGRVGVVSETEMHRN